MVDNPSMLVNDEVQRGANVEIWRAPPHHLYTSRGAGAVHDSSTQDHISLSQ